MAKNPFMSCLSRRFKASGPTAKTTPPVASHRASSRPYTALTHRLLIAAMSSDRGTGLDR